VIVELLRNAKQVLLGVFNRLLDREWNLTGLAMPNANDVMHVTDDDNGCEGEPTSTLHDLRHAVDLHNPLGELEAPCIDALSTCVTQCAHSP
jgi:hypothetical protein